MSRNIASFKPVRSIFRALHRGSLYLFAGAICFLTACASQAPVSRAATEAEEALGARQNAKAVQLYTLAIQADENNPLLYGGRGEAYTAMGKAEEAFNDYDMAVKKALAAPKGKIKKKQLASIYYDRGYALELAGHTLEGLEDYAQTMQLEPSFPDAHGNAAWILATHPDASVRDPKRALEYALFEAKLSGMKDSAVLDTLAAAYAATGQFEEALRVQKEALAKAVDHEDKFHFAERLKLYEEKKPYIQPNN